MNFVSALLYPIALLLPAAGAKESDSDAEDAAPHMHVLEDGQEAHVWPQVPPQMLEPDWPFAERVLQEVEPEPGWQVHIEQRVQIRITPRGPSAVRPEMFVGIPDEDIRAHFTERKIGKCVSISGIAGVQPDRGNRLLLYMRDRRLVAAELERSCRARDFYSGFYLGRTSDGQLCVDRDILLSRSGMNCKLTRIRQLVESDR